MKKNYTLLLFLLAALCSNAQNLALKIPANANAVATLNTAQLNQLMPIEDWDKTALGKKLQELRGNDSTFQYNSVKDFGINLNSTTYYFHTEDDSMHFNCILIPLSDASKMDQLIGKKELIRLPENTRKFTENDSTGFFMWNNEWLIYVKAIMKDQYFNDIEVAKRHGLYFQPPYDFDIDSTMVVLDSADITEDTVVIGYPVIPSDSAAVLMDEEEMEESFENAPGEGDFEYYKDLSIKKKITAFCGTTLISELFYKYPASSILNNSEYIKSTTANAVASIWVDKPMNMYYNLLPDYLTYKKFMPLGSTMLAKDFGYENFSASLLMDQQQINIHYQMEMSPELATIQEKILDRKLNKRFYKYINTDSVLGYMSWSLDTKAYLEQFPALLQRTYGSMDLGVSSEEISLAGEFLSFLLDEEAIAKMVKGDAMVLFNGLFQQETTYTDYTFDDDFKSTEVKKTKTETLPHFLMMVSSEENNLVRKLVNYGVQKSVVKLQGAYYEIEIPKSPMRLFFTYKDDIFFLTNSIESIQQISNGSFKANISKQEKKFLGNHNFTMYINPKNISGKIAKTDLGATESLADMMNVFNKMGPVRVKVNPVKNNISSADMWMEVPAGNTNSLTFFFDLFEGLIK